MPRTRWADSAVILRRLKKAYDARGIEIPFPHVILYPGGAKDSSAPAHPVRLAPESSRSR